jgi:hypothetical protein
MNNEDYPKSEQVKDGLFVFAMLPLAYLFVVFALSM